MRCWSPHKVLRARTDRSGSHVAAKPRLLLASHGLDPFPASQALGALINGESKERSWLAARLSCEGEKVGISPHVRTDKEVNLKLTTRLTVRGDLIGEGSKSGPGAGGPTRRPSASAARSALKAVRTTAWPMS